MMQMQPSPTSARKKDRWWHSAAFALSLANLCLLRIWVVSPPHLNREDTGLLEQGLPPVHYAALLANTVLLTALIWAWLRWVGDARAWARRLALAAGSVALVAVISYHLRFVLQSVSEAIPVFGWSARDWVRPAPLLVASATAGFAAWAFVRFRGVREAARGLVVLLAVPALFNIGIGVRMIVTHTGEPQIVAAAGTPAPASRRAPTRVVVALFDEWDHRLTFERRDPTLKLPQIDRFRAQAVYATNAIRGGRRTLASVAAMTTGLPVDEVEVRGPNRFLLKLNGATPAWQQTPTVFSRARERGFSSAVVGWYLPYCRLFGSSLAQCWSWPFFWSAFPAVPSFSGSLGRQIYMATDLGPLSPWPEPLDSFVSRSTRFAVLEKARQVAADPSFDFVYLHLPMTHFPYFYDPQTGTWGERAELPRGYSNGLAFADRTVGEIRSAMEQSGVWDRSVVVLTADHQLRFNVDATHRQEKRVPLLIHLPGQTETVAVDSPVRMTILRDLALALLDGKLPKPNQVAAFLENAETTTQEPGHLATR